MRGSYKELFVQNVDLFTSKQRYLISTCISKSNESRSQICVSRIKYVSTRTGDSNKLSGSLGLFVSDRMGGTHLPPSPPNLEITEFKKIKI